MLTHPTLIAYALIQRGFSLRPVRPGEFPEDQFSPLVTITAPQGAVDVVVGALVRDQGLSGTTRVVLTQFGRGLQDALRDIDGHLDGMTTRFVVIEHREAQLIRGGVYHDRREEAERSMASAWAEQLQRDARRAQEKDVDASEKVELYGRLAERLVDGDLTGAVALIDAEIQAHYGYRVADVQAVRCAQ